MTAAERARPKWAWRRAKGSAGALAASRDNVAPIFAILILVLTGVVLICAAIGLADVARNDSRLESQRHAALQAALDELRPVFGNSDHFDSGELYLLERRADLADLRFDTELSSDTGREVQSMTGEGGRILGWFSWTPDRTLSRAMTELWWTGAIVGIALLICGGLALRSARRLVGAVARNTRTIAALTTQDVLTGLPNRRVMLQRLEEALSVRRSGIVVFALIDIDGFHDINDTLGRAGGDAMFVSIAERLKAALPPGATLGRFEDDEFAVVMAGTDKESAIALGDKLMSALADPIHMDQPWQIGATIGIAQAPEDGTTGDEIQRHAVLALRAAKRSGRGAVRRFLPEIHQEHAERRFFRRELEAAIHNKTFDVHYQPVVAAEGGGIVGVEALLRWTHPVRGPIAPSLFIPLAEESGLMNILGELVLRRALADGARWKDLFVSVNLSPVQIRSPGLLDLVRDALSESGLPAPRLTLEITEGVLIDNPEEALRKLEALRAVGVATALDDFGSGYSSLNYLQKFPFDRLKIDRGFVASLGNSGNAGAIIQSVVTLGHALGMKVLAEGVETNEQRVLLRLAGCDELQGFLFANACPAESIDKILARPPAARSSGRR
jgi:diguanylate cyclase (GGDEF)-like protein